MIYIMEILITSCLVGLPDCTREMISVITLYTKVTHLGVPPILRQANMGMVNFLTAYSYHFQNWLTGKWKPQTSSFLGGRAMVSSCFPKSKHWKGWLQCYTPWYPHCIPVSRISGDNINKPSSIPLLSTSCISPICIFFSQDSKTIQSPIPRLWFQGFLLLESRMLDGKTKICKIDFSLIYSHPEKDRKVMKRESSPNKKVFTFLSFGGWF